jgi:sulfur carrier protein ThiS
MSAFIRPNEALRPYFEGRSEIEVAPGQTVRETLAALGIPAEIVAVVVVNDDQLDKDYILLDGDRVRLLAVIGGG